MRGPRYAGKASWVLPIVAVGVAACSDPGPAPPRLESCTAGGVAIGPLFDRRYVVTPGEPQHMAWADGILYLYSTDGLRAVPDNGGELTMVSEAVWADEIWVRGQNVLLASRDQLWQVPRAGGATTMLLDGGGKNDPRRSLTDVIPEYHLLDETHFYWSTTALSSSDMADATTVWRMPLAGGPVEKVGEVPVNIEGMGLTPGGLLVAGWGAGEQSDDTFFLPLAGGAPRVLDKDPKAWNLVAVDSAGALWTRIFPTQGGQVNTTGPLEISPADGSPWARLSRHLPDSFVWPDWSTLDDQGGRFILGQELFDDDLPHDSVFFVAANGDATRLACEPTGHMYFAKARALSPDAVYLVMESVNEWQLVRIARPTQQP